MSESRDWGESRTAVIRDFTPGGYAWETKSCSSSSESRDYGESRNGCSHESREDASYGARKVRNEFRAADIDKAIKKHRQDMANQIQQLKNNLLSRKVGLEKELNEIVIELKALEQLERQFN